ncbi:DUF1273 domain-containing protein [Fructobacillus sp. M1-13]|uniref:UPF0398 protein G6R27_02040 n=1 Tax=Fructobacillus papyriferae TaxID=2713171 RepID=A0ABS5QPS6_9LACO|nr:DUF1273 domain-containing protein [Fructobacillus papyriferae]MBS9334817.1 DUF1273 domain-containing protein [Fructobacillus papyriferae]MCD2158807.1 DUF1273 domain-containing protein [Fructobacillus papyriferae]
MSRIWVTGYRSYELGVFKDKDPKVTVLKYALKKRLVEQLEQGMDWLITGGQPGVELWAADLAVELKKDYPQLHLAVFVPFEGFGKNWKEANQAKLAKAKSQADFFAATYKGDYQGPFQLQGYQDFILNHTDGALLVYDNEFEGKSAYDAQAMTRFQEKAPYPVNRLDMEALQEYANDYQEAVNEERWNG